MRLREGRARPRSIDRPWTLVSDHRLDQLAELGERLLPARTAHLDRNGLRNPVLDARQFGAADHLAQERRQRRRSGTLARLTLQRAQPQWHELDAHLAWCDARIDAHAKDTAAVQAAATLLGIGPVTASAVVATVGGFKQLGNGAQFEAWIGLTPKQHSSGGKKSPGGITQHGVTCLRTLLFRGEKSAVMTANRHQPRSAIGNCPTFDLSGWPQTSPFEGRGRRHSVPRLMTCRCV
ncbi:MAG: IS110 family transposase [Ramlibacter sp.]|nr:IS110 family transposase [Ramlibacter sp.]